MINKTLHELEKKKEERQFMVEEAANWIFFNNRLDEIYQEEETYWQLRSKQLWLEAGDANTKYFHTIATHRSKKKSNT